MQHILRLFLAVLFVGALEGCHSNLGGIDRFHSSQSVIVIHNVTPQDFLVQVDGRKYPSNPALYMSVGLGGLYQMIEEGKSIMMILVRIMAGATGPEEVHQTVTITLDSSPVELMIAQRSLPPIGN